MTRPDVKPLLTAFTALRASENAERNGNLKEAMQQAANAIGEVEEWLYQLGLANLEKV